MNHRRHEDYLMCQTSEAGERAFSNDEIESIRAEISNRIIELFGCQQLSQIGYRLRMTRRELLPVLNGEKPPSIEMLLGIRRATGSSIDWILTGNGPKFLPNVLSFPTPQVIFAADRFIPVEPTAAAGAVL